MNKIILVSLTAVVGLIWYAFSHNAWMGGYFVGLVTGIIVYSPNN